MLKTFASTGRKYMERFKQIKKFSSTIPLSHDVYLSTYEPSTEQKDIVFLHGILGSKKNFRTASKQFLQLNNSFQRAITVDHRGHGQNSHFSYHMISKNHSVYDCVNDLQYLLSNLSSNPSILCGHSFGGKVCLAYVNHCLLNNLPIPEHTWVLDALPGKYDKETDVRSSDSVHGIMDILSNLPKQFESRNEVVNVLISKGISQPITLWLVTNLIPVDGTDGKVQFSFDISIIKELFDDFSTLDMWDFLFEFKRMRLIGHHIHFIRAGKNLLWTDKVLKMFSSLTENSSPVHLWTMPHVGHWIHSEDLQGTLDVIQKGSRVVNPS